MTVVLDNMQTALCTLAMSQLGLTVSGYIQVSSTNVIDCLIVNPEGTEAVLQDGVDTEGGVEGLHQGSGHLRGQVDGELQLGLLAIVHRHPPHQEGGEAAGPSATTEREKLSANFLILLSTRSTISLPTVYCSVA